MLWTIHAEYPLGANGYRTRPSWTIFHRDGSVVPGAVGGQTRAQTDVTHFVAGDTVDDYLAAFIKGHGVACALVPVEPPNPANACPLDGALGCRMLARARQAVEQARQHGHRAGPLGIIDITVDPQGAVRDPAHQHTVYAAEQAGLDWRRFAVVAFGVRGYQGYRPPVPYRVWFDDDTPDPRLPSAPPALHEPRPTVQTPKAVRRWVDERISAGEIMLVDALPPPAVRKQIRTAAKVTQRQAADLLGLKSTEAIRLWEVGKREPESENRARYVALLNQWHAHSGNGKRPEPETVHDTSSVCNDPANCSIHGHMVTPRARPAIRPRIPR